jgi:hypothetical protein
VCALQLQRMLSITGSIGLEPMAPARRPADPKSPIVEGDGKPVKVQNFAQRCCAFLMETSAQLRNSKNAAPKGRHFK